MAPPDTSTVHYVADFRRRCWHMPSGCVASAHSSPRVRGPWFFTQARWHTHRPPLPGVARFLLLRPISCLIAGSPAPVKWPLRPFGSRSNCPRVWSFALFGPLMVSVRWFLIIVVPRSRYPRGSLLLAALSPCRYEGFRPFVAVRPQGAVPKYRDSGGPDVAMIRSVIPDVVP